MPLRKCNKPREQMGESDHNIDIFPPPKSRDEFLVNSGAHVNSIALDHLRFCEIGGAVD